MYCKIRLGICLAQHCRQFSSNRLLSNKLFKGMVHTFTLLYFTPQLAKFVTEEHLLALTYLRKYYNQILYCIY